MNDEHEACVLPQPVLDPATATDKDLPVNLLRKCCRLKSCGNTELYLQIVVDPPTGDHIYSYRRLSNDDHFWPPVRSLAAVVELLNNPADWPVDEDKWETLLHS